jgi:hypothetical protein
MDDQTRVLLRGVFRFLDQQERILTQALLCAMACRAAMKELNPHFENLYLKYYQAASDSPQKKASDDTHEVLAGLIQQLNTGGGDEN